jgi:membrane fusion protein, multidrug efflux system
MPRPSSSAQPPLSAAARPAVATLPLFRPDAVSAARSGRETLGAPLILVSAWHRGMLALALSLLAGAALAVALVPLHNYARGTVLVQASARTTITTTQGRLIASVRVFPGAPVAASDILVELDSQPDRDLRRLTRKSLDEAITTLLRDPADRAQQLRVTELQSELGRIDSRLRDLVLRAPHAGTVADVWARTGQLAAPGIPLLSLVRDSAPLQVTGVLPARFRPMLAPGQQMTLELEGYPQVRHRLRVGQISEQAVGPAQVQRMLGIEAADSLSLSGPSVVVTGLLEERQFPFLGQRYRFHDGMTGTLEVRVGTQPLWAILFPFLVRGEP